MKRLLMHESGPKFCATNGLRAKKITKKVARGKPHFACSEIDRLKACTTKNMFKAVLLELSSEWREIIGFYLTDCFVFDLYTRKIENKKHLLSKREILYSVVENPSFLELDCHFDNNLIKNFCTGLANFLKRNLSKIKENIRAERVCDNWV